MFGREKYRIIRSFYWQPIWLFALEFVLLAPITLGAEIPGLASIYLFLSPWLILALALLNLPLLRLAFDSFRLDMPVRRNHALEHATVLVLRGQGHRHVAGRASGDGFRVSGGPTPAQIRDAFDVVRRQVAERATLTYVSASCGSNRVTALALAFLLLVLVTIVSLALRPPLFLRAVALVTVVLVFVALRHRVGNWLQARCFMATDFRAVSATDVRKVKTAVWDHPPTYFVHTVVEVASSTARPTP